MSDLVASVKKNVAVLLGYCHGEKYLQDQLDSIWSQGENIKIWISNDDYENQPCELLNRLVSQKGNGLVEVLNGPKKGFARNFLSLIGNADIKADFFAFSDQDDIWEQDKISRAINWLNTIPSDCPAYYCSRTRLINEQGQEIGLSPLFKRKPSFKNALVQNIAGGNTMVINQAARDLLAQTKDASVVSHDWWAYMLITGAGGQVFYDPHPTIRYRQHNGNLVGSNQSLCARAMRLVMMLNGRYRKWNQQNCENLQQYRHLLTTENKLTLDAFCEARKNWVLPRIYGIWKSEVYRQSFPQNMGLTAATILNRI